jgi:type IV pilus assembly protein PilB
MPDSVEKVRKGTKRLKTGFHFSRLGSALIDEGIITRQELEDALEYQRINSGSLEKALIATEKVTEREISEFLGKKFNVRIINLNEIEIEQSLLRLIPSEVAQKYLAIPVRKDGRVLTLAMANPLDLFAIDDIKFLTGCEIEPAVCSETAIRASIDAHYDQADSLTRVMKGIEEENLEVIEDEDDIDLTNLREATEDAPVVKLVNTLIFDAVNKGASDIHIECYEKNMRVRFRIDGVLYEMMKPPLRLRAAIISRVKIMAELDIAERRIPQDGRIKVRVKDTTIDIRVSTLPTLFGEKVVMRILDQSNLVLDLEKLGFDRWGLDQFEKSILLPYGMVLVTGPTGSGKSTTLYSALTRLNQITTNIMTAEDPVEYNLAGINQVQIKEKIGLTFASALRSFLRQDPNIIMVGEIRDLETAEISIKAALTGHLVLSTLHTNDAPSTINRLIDMGVEPFLVASSINIIVAQRLIRKVCTHCAKEVQIKKEVQQEIDIPDDEIGTLTFYQGKGCVECNGIGYKGRIACMEAMPVTPEIRELILERASAKKIMETAMNQGMKTLRHSAIEKLKKGMTTVEEVLRETSKH